MLRYSDAKIVAVIDRDTVGRDLRAIAGIELDVPIVASVTDALPFAPDILVIGIAPSGGALPDEWKQEIGDAVAAGLSVANGLHSALAHLPELQSRLRAGQWIWDIRQEPAGLTIGSGLARSLACDRVLTVGTDMAVGKMSASLELHRASLAAGKRSQFVGTGQAGILIAGDGVPLDAVRVDFAAGAVEQAVMRYGPDCDVVFVEGQGSLFHPGSTATLPLLRGTQPTHLVLVHRAGQTHIHSVPEVAIPPLPEAIHLYETLAHAGESFGCAKVVAIALNTRHLDDAAAQQAIRETERETGLPCTDTVRYGATGLLSAMA
jgi:uncharacterized NAD-dependent epimerase/dehydratase family protein